MNLFKRLSNLVKPRARTSPAQWVTVRCDRCGETLQARINLYNDLSVEYGEKESDTTYVCRKQLVGEQGCFQRIEVTLTFDAKRLLIDREISGGQFIDEQ
jgi:hypothetical protein